MARRPEARRGFATPRVVTDFFEQKRLRPAFSWLDVWGEEHAYAFTVAKAVEAELLGTFKRSIGEALRGGQSFDTWREGIEKDLRGLGWWGPRMVADPDGLDPARMVDFSGHRRLKTIFWSNMQSARSAGQWDRAQRTKAALPYILYVRTAASDPRPEHLGWVGIILPVDHPFWATHWPPNGWGCKCSIRQITAREAERLLGRDLGDGGIFYRREPPDLGPPRVFQNRRTGEITEVPVGIDPGWQTNPGLGRARTLTRRLQETLEEAGGDVAHDAIMNVMESEVPRTLAGLTESVPVPVAVAPELQVALDGASPIVVAYTRTIADKVARPERGVEIYSVIAELPELLTRGVVIDQGQDLRRSVIIHRDDGWWRIVVQASKAGRFLRVVTMHRIGDRRAEKLLRESSPPGRT